MSPAAKQTDTTDTSQGWRPEEGEVLTGEITRVSRGWSDWTQKYYPLVTVREDGTGRMVDVHAFHHTLERDLMETKPKVGDAIQITYEGTRKTKDGKRTVAVYNVTVPGATGAEVWDMLSAQDAPRRMTADDEIAF